MTKGKIVNKQTGLEITGERSAALNDDAFTFAIDGTTENNVFFAGDWEFIEDKPSAYEQYLALKPGARFTLSGTSGRGRSRPRIKLDEDTYAYKKYPGDWSTNGAFKFDVKSLTIEEVTD